MYETFKSHKIIQNITLQIILVRIEYLYKNKLTLFKFQYMSKVNFKS